MKIKFTGWSKDPDEYAEDGENFLLDPEEFLRVDTEEYDSISVYLRDGRSFFASGLEFIND